MPQLKWRFRQCWTSLGPKDRCRTANRLSMKIEPWPGGRWYRDLGNNAGHLWGHVQVIKPPTLLEITGPMPMSYPAVNHVQYRLKEKDGGTQLTFLHRAMGLILPEHRDGMPEGWQHWLDRIRELAERKQSARRHNDERLLRCGQRPENADVGAKSPRDFCMGPPERHPGVGAQVSRLPGSARDALDRTRPVAFHGNLLALGAAARFASPHCFS